VATPTADPEPDIAARRSSRGSVARDVIITFGGRIALTLVIIVGDVIVARSLGPDGKGAFALVLALSSLGAVILGLGLDRSLAVYAAKSIEIARRAFANAFWWVVVVGALGVVGIIALYEPLGAIMPPLTSTELMLGALALPFELAYAIGIVGLLGRQGVVAYNVLRFIRRALLSLLLLAVVVLGSIDLELVLWLNLAALAVTVVGIGWASMRAGMFGLRGESRLLLGQLSFGGRAVVGTMAERLHYRANTFLLTAFISVAATGVFSVALALAETLWYLPGALGLVLFSRAVRPDTDSAGIASAMTRTMLALMLIAAVPLFLIAPTLIEIVYGAEFAAAGPALQILLPGVVAYSIVSLLASYVIARGAPGKAAAALVAGLVINLAANAVLIPLLGMNGAALASTISYTSTALLVLLLYRALSGQGIRDTLILRRSDVSARWADLRSMMGRLGSESA
jgi:O-antigen/teichoic acid export membrane protein